MNKAILLFSLVLMQATLHAKAPRDPIGDLVRPLAGYNKTLSNIPTEAKAGFLARMGQKPIIEIIQAWLAYDQMESVGSHYRQKGNKAPEFIKDTAGITEEQARRSYTDITPLLKNALAASKQGLYIQRSPEVILNMRGKNGTISPTAIDQTAILASERTPCQDAEPVMRESSQHPLLKGDARTAGIIYRDADGIHFKRFEGWQNIALPAVASLTLAPWPEASNCNGGFFYGHQFEETCRGLVTATVKGTSPLCLLATDRFGWGSTFYDGSSFCPGVYMPLEGIGEDMYTLHRLQKNKWFGAPASLNLFRFVWGQEGSFLDCKEGGFAVHPATGAASTTSYCAATSQYKYYDENGQLQSLKMPGLNADPSINEKQPGALAFPGTPKQPVDIWFAFDRSPAGVKFMLGTGTPQSEADFTRDGSKVRVLYQKNVTTSPYLRNFAFSAEDSNGMVYNIESRPLSPAKKFCCPPFCQGKFFFWRPEWESSSPDSFSIFFKARGKAIHVGLAALRAADRVNNEDGCFDYSADYALRAEEDGTITIEKYTNDPADPITALPVTLLAPLSTTDAETYNDYWLSYANGLITFGTGSTLGQEVIAEALDERPVRAIRAYSFSSSIRSTDYIGIAVRGESVLSTQSQPDSRGVYSYWPKTQQFALKGRGAFSFMYQYQNAEKTATDNGDTTLMIGLSAKTPAANTALVPPYQVVLGSNGNTAHDVLLNSTLVSHVQAPKPLDATAAAVLVKDGKWHDLWVAYDNGRIVYGTGTAIGYNILGSWQDATAEGPNLTTMRNIAFFSLTAAGTAPLAIRLNRVTNIPDQHTYNAPAQSAPFSQPLWASSLPGQGVCTFSVSGSPLSTIEISLAENATPATQETLCEIVINDPAKKAFIRKNNIAQEGVSLTPAQRPSPTGTYYWICWYKNAIAVGTGRNPGDSASRILTWQDDEKTAAPLSRISVAATGGPLSFKMVQVSSGTEWQPVLESLLQAAPRNA